VPTKEIQDLMTQEINLLKRLVALALDKKEAILHDDIGELGRIINEEKKELMIANSLLGQNHAQRREAPDLQSVNEERASLVRQIKELNLFNQQLLEDSLAVAGYCLRVIHGDEGSNLYGSSGNVETQGNKSVINWRG